MNMRLNSFIAILLLLSGAGTAIGSHPVEDLEDVRYQDPLGLMLTWQQDPTSTMTIDWYTGPEGVPSGLQYQRVGSDVWLDATAEITPFPFSENKIHRVELTGLDADTEYLFRIGEQSRIRKFRTMPETANRPIRFAAGGDVRHRVEWMEQTNRRVAAYNPDFIVWGGDLAYADGREDRLYRWLEFVDAMMHTAVTADGRVIPVLASLGNHEVRGGYYHNNDHVNRQELPEYTQTDESRAQIAPYYYALFPFPGQPGYGILDFGDYMSILLLDTDHTNPIEGEQTAWLERVLSERENVPHLFPNYHVPAYPSVRNPGGGTHTRVRDHWVPLFERYGVRVAFENHDHIYKRTWPIRDGEIRSDGVVYIGDGAWGVSTRDIGASHDEYAWYLKRASSERHFILTTIQGPHQHFMVVNEEGEIIDEYPRTTHVDREIFRFAIPWEPETESY
jgi:acid phosphatase type 7